MDAVRELGLLLGAEGYDEDGLLRALGGLDGRRARAFREHGILPAAPLVDLFRLMLPVERSELGPLDVESLAAEGLLEPDGDRVRSTAQITPWLGLLTAHDPDDAVELRPDHVPGSNSSAETLARATVRLPVGRALDLGTGSGIQALLAAGHAAQVTAVDVNPRALRYAALSARLNGVEAIETREGSWLEPVAGERFDLVVCNPPYVLSPDSDFLFRDGGDGLAGLLVRAIPEHLAEGGFGHVLCNWATRAGETPWSAVEDWTRDGGCDALVVTFGSEGPLSYASRWAERLGARDDAGHAARVARWLEHYRQAGIETIWLGVVVLRRRSGAETWFRGLGSPEPTRGFAGEHLLRIVAAQDRLAAGRPLDGEILRLVPGATIVGEHATGRPTRIAVSLEEGLGLVTPVDSETLAALDGDRPLEPGPTRAAVLHLYELGFLEMAQP